MRKDMFTRLFIISATLAVLPVMLFTIISVYMQERGLEPFKIKLFFMLFVMVLTVLSFIVAYIIATKTEKPLKELISASDRFSKGEFDYRVPDADIEDFQKVNHAFNEMASSINMLTAELEDAKNYFKQLYDSISNYVIILSPNRTIIEVNERFLHDNGLDREDIVGRKCWEVVHSYDSPCEDKGQKCHLESVYKDGVQRSATHVHTIKGKKAVHNIVYTPFRDKEGNINFVIEDIRDISRVVEMQERVKDSEKMAALGRLISRLSHEINNPLAIISGFLQVISEAEISDEAKLKTALGKIRDGADRINSLMRILMSFAGVDNVPLHPVSVNDALMNSLSLLNSEIKGNAVKIITEFDPSEPYIMAREDVIRAFYNISLNAMEAMSDAEERVLAIKTDAGPQNVTITFKDTGAGVPEELLGSLIEPFFTTKEFGRLGMGLSASYSIIKNYGGDMKFINDKGLSVIISLKRAA